MTTPPRAQHNRLRKQSATSRPSTHARHATEARGRPLLLLACTLLCLLPIACNRPAPTATPAAQPRYVVLSPALAIILRDLGHEHRIVARHAHDMVLDESLPVAGELGRLDYQAILAANPTHVLIEWGAPTQPLPERLLELARERDFDILRFSLLTLHDIRAAVTRLESDLPPTDRGPEPGYWQARMDQAWNAPNTDPQGQPLYAPAGRILLIAATDPLIGITGPGSWHHQILQSLGGVPAITDGAPWMELSAEDILRLAPDAIILLQPRPRDDDALTTALTTDLLRDRLGPVARLDIPALRNNHIALIDDPLAHTPSTAMVALTDRMRAILHAWSSTNQQP